ncbi:hypothetical protein FS749_000399 [Ceratobasidium sp. UAMH 11750]|nr:hypothetical protein FS749_000399 [Ceratobasidium sp. UAMH 11750]
MWRTAEWKTPRLPFCPVGLSTPQYAALVFTNDCSLCYKSSPNSKLETTLRVRLCESCHESELINVWSIKNYEEERLICNLSLTIKAPTVPSTYARWGASDGTSPHCLRRDLEKLYQTRKEFFQSGDRAGLARWEQYNQFSVEEFDEFAEMLERFLIYPKLTARQKNQLEESMGYDDDDSWGEEPYSDGGEEPSDEEECMEGEGDTDESEGSMDEDD